MSVGTVILFAGVTAIFQPPDLRPQHVGYRPQVLTSTGSVVWAGEPCLTENEAMAKAVEKMKGMLGSSMP